MGFPDLSEFFDPDLELTIKGNTYRIPAASAADGLKLRQILATPNLVMSDQQELREITKLLGAHWKPKTERLPAFGPNGERQLDDNGDPAFHDVDMGTWVGGVWQEMSDNGVTWDQIMHVGRTAMLKEAFNLTSAETYWAEGLKGGSGAGNPTPPEPATAPGENRATRRAATKKTPAKKAPAKRAAKKAAPKAST